MNTNRLFQSKHLERNLKKNAVRGGAFTVGTQGAKFALRILSTAILARFLLPEDYGLIGMTIVVSGFVGVVRDGGLLYATIQKKEINHEEVSLLFWINVAIGFVIAIILLCLSPIIATIFAEARLTALLCALAIPFLFGGFAVQHNALLRRQMEFGKIAVVEIGSLVIGIGFGIGFAVAQFGYWSLAFMEIATAVSAMFLAWMMLPWKPSAPRKIGGMLSTWQFGGNIMLFNIVNYVTRNADNALIGWYWGAASLGLYSRAYSLLLMPIRNINAPFSAVALPILSRAASDPVKLKRYFTEGASMVAAVIIPIVAYAAVFANDLVRILLGESWMESAHLFRLLAIPALFIGASQPISWLYIVLDRTRLLRNVGLFSAPINLAAFCIGLPYGPEGVAIGYTISSCLLYYPVLRYGLRDTGIKLMDVIGTWRQPVVASAISIAAGLLVRFFLSSHVSQIVSSILSIGAFSAVYFLMMIFVFGWRGRVAVWYSRKVSSQNAQSEIGESVV